MTSTGSVVGSGRRWVRVLAIAVAVVVVLVLAAAAGLWFLRVKAERSVVGPQYETPAYAGMQRLDFAPFAEAMKAMTAEQVSAMDAALSGADLVAMRRMLAAGELSSERLVLYYLKRIERYDVDGLNSVIALNPDALRIARDLDARGHAVPGLGPLSGIPVVLKDIFATVDMPTTAGAKAMQGAQTGRDAFLVRRLREAGAVILGKANLTEWSGGMSSSMPNGFSVLGGQTRNPYGRFDVGGSSSGPAAAVAANLAPVAVGAETTGSLIYPASQNSVFALKPSLGLISRDGVVPLTSVTDSPGPVARSATDLAVLMNVLRGIDPADAASAAAAPAGDVDFAAGLDGNALRDLRVGFVQTPLTDLIPLWPGSRVGDNKLLDRVVGQLESAGAKVKRVDLDFKADVGPILRYDFRRQLNDYLQATDAPVGSLQELIAFNREDLPNRAPFGQDLLEAAAQSAMSPDDYDRAVAELRRSSRESIDGIMREHDVEVLVSASSYASSGYDAAGYPALSVPIGYRPSGEPLGMTLIGRYLDDAKLVRIAYAYEQHTDPRRDPEL